MPNTERRSELERLRLLVRLQDIKIKNLQKEKEELLRFVRNVAIPKASNGRTASSPEEGLGRDPEPFRGLAGLANVA